eukprot:1605104-Rhodomonas_salina.3
MAHLHATLQAPGVVSSTGRGGRREDCNLRCIWSVLDPQGATWLTVDLPRLTISNNKGDLATKPRCMTAVPPEAKAKARADVKASDAEIIEKK